jgi:hypothetical protein
MRDQARQERHAPQPEGMGEAIGPLGVETGGRQHNFERPIAGGRIAVLNGPNILAHPGEQSQHNNPSATSV